jgi:hypothetical protein
VLSLALGAVAGPPTVTTVPVDRITFEAEQIDSLHWEVLIWLDNHGPLAAMTLPLRWSGGRRGFRIDSVEYRDLRTEYFAVKTFLADSLRQTVLIGLISDLGVGLPPLEPGSEPIARLHFTARGAHHAPLTIDTTFIPPHNTLQIVAPDARAITPQFGPRR